MTSESITCRPSLTIELQKHLHSGKLDDAQNLVINGDQNVIKESGWDLIYYVLTHLKENLKDVDVVSCCDVILLHVAKTGNPKEVLLGFLEQIGRGLDYAILIILLKPLQIALQRLPGKRGSTLKWTLDTLHSYISNLPLPGPYKYEGKERLLLDLDPNVQQTTEVLHHYLVFFQPFVEEASLLNAKKNTPFIERICYQRDILCHNLLLMLDHPLAYLDLSCEENKAESSSRTCATKVMNYLKMLKGNTFSLYEFVNNLLPDTSSGNAELDEDSDKELGKGKVSVIAASILAYLTMQEHLGNLPLVYAPIYLLHIHLNFTVALLSNKEELVQFKGLHLFNSILKIVENRSVSKAVLDIPEALNVCQCLINIMVYSSINEYRQLALSIFKNYIEKFTLNGRCCVLLNLLSSENHSGVRSLLIQLYKDNLHHAFTEGSDNPFNGNNLQKALVLITKLPESVETDLVNESDCVIATLNFLRYLVISDKRGINRTGVWNFIDDPTNEYLKNLRTGIMLSKAHYKLKSVEVEEERKSAKNRNSAVELGGLALPSLPPGQQSFVLHSALLTFDVMESILVRLEEHI